MVCTNYEACGSVRTPGDGPAIIYWDEKDLVQPISRMIMSRLPIVWSAFADLDRGWLFQYLEMINLSLIIGRRTSHGRPDEAKESTTTSPHEI